MTARVNCAQYPAMVGIRRGVKVLVAAKPPRVAVRLGPSGRRLLPWSIRYEAAQFSEVYGHYPTEQAAQVALPFARAHSAIWFKARRWTAQMAGV